MHAIPEELVEFNRERVRGHLAQALFELMESYGLNRTQLAALLDVGKSRVTQLLSGCENLSAETLADILLVFGRTPYLTLGTNPHEIRFPVDEGSVNDEITHTNLPVAALGTPDLMNATYRFTDYLGNRTSVVTAYPTVASI